MKTVDIITQQHWNGLPPMKLPSIQELDKRLKKLRRHMTPRTDLRDAS